MIVDKMIQNILSNNRWPSHRPIGFVNPFENCMAWIEVRRSIETYNAKNAGNTPYHALIMLIISKKMKLEKTTIAAP